MSGGHTRGGRVFGGRKLYLVRRPAESDIRQKLRSNSEIKDLKTQKGEEERRERRKEQGGQSGCRKRVTKKRTSFRREEGKGGWGPYRKEKTLLTQKRTRRGLGISQASEGALTEKPPHTSILFLLIRLWVGGGEEKRGAVFKSVEGGDSGRGERPQSRGRKAGGRNT